MGRGKQGEKDALGFVVWRIYLFWVLNHGFASQRCHGSGGADHTLRPSKPRELSAAPIAAGDG